MMSELKPSSRDNWGLACVLLAMVLGVYLFIFFVAYAWADILPLDRPQLAQPTINGQICAAAARDARAAMDWASANAERDPAGAAARLRAVNLEVARACVGQ